MADYHRETIDEGRDSAGPIVALMTPTEITMASMVQAAACRRR
jgi:hypothetical protein